MNHRSCQELEAVAAVRQVLWGPERMALAFVVGVAALLASLAGCGSENRPAAPSPAGAAAVRSVKLALNWYPEAEHGGFYAAQVHGFFQEVGLDVEIIKGGPNAPVLQQVASGQVEFGISNADGILLGRAQEADVVALLAPLQISPRCLLVHEESGIDQFDQLVNLTIGMSNTQPFYHFLKRRVPLTGVTIVPYPGNVARFLVDTQFAQQGYVFSEPFLARQQGARPRTLLLADLGFNPYTSVLITRGRRIREQPELVRKVVRACQRGWAAYLEKPAATNRLLHELNPEMSPEALDYGTEALRSSVLNDDATTYGLGHMTLERWQTLTDQLVECEQLEAGAVDPHAAFTTEFLEPAGQPNSTP